MLAAGVRVLLAVDGSRVVGLLPVERVVGPGALRVTGIAGWRWLTPDHGDVVAAPGREVAVAVALTAALVRSRGWDVLDLDGLTAGGALATEVARVDGAPRRLHRAEPVLAPYTDLPAVRSAGLASRNLRKQLAKGLRSVTGQGGGLAVVTDPGEVAVRLGELMRLHNLRFGQRSAVFATPERRRFHQQAARRLAAEGAARIYRLFTSEGDAALLYCLVGGDRVLAYQIGMAPDRSVSPGRTVYGQAMLSAAAEGFAEFDMLRGPADHKARLASGVRRDLRLRLLRPTPRTAAAGAARVLRRLRPPPATGDDGG